MNIVLEIHFVFAFLVLLTAITMGWVQIGRRTMVAVTGIQVLIGIVLAAIAGATHQVMPPNLWVHILCGFLAMFAYIAGRRLGDAAPQNRVGPFLFSLLGLIILLFTAWYGSVLATTHPL